jgi:hypothetical protein
MDIPADELGRRFVVTYYRLIYRSPDNFIRLFSPEACLSRTISCERTEFHPVPDRPLAAVDSTTRTLRIATYSSMLLLDRLVVSVSGFADENRFTQQFILRLDDQKWMIVSDVYYEFDAIRPDLVSVEPVPDAPKAAPRPGVPYSATREKKATVEMLDPARSITLPDLPKQYQGDDLVATFSKFGVVSRQCYTFKRVFIEYETPGASDAAFAASQPGAAGRPMYKGTYVSVLKGVVAPAGAARR